jgi:hypothetical protein
VIYSSIVTKALTLVLVLVIVLILIVQNRRRVGAGRSVRRVIGLRERSNLIAQNATYRAHRRHIVLVTDALVQEFIAYFPREYARVLVLVLAYLAHDLGRGHAWLAAANGARQNAARFLEAGQYFAHTSMGHLELTRDVTRSYAFRGQIYNLHSNRVGQRSTVDKHAAQLIHLTIGNAIRIFLKGLDEFRL